MRALAGGNLRLVAALAEGLPVVYNSVVTNVTYSAKGVAVRAAGREFRGQLPCSQTLIIIMNPDTH